VRLVGYLKKKDNIRLFPSETVSLQGELLK